MKMNFSEYLLTDRPLSMLSSLTDELHLENNKNYLFELSYLSSLRIRGERSAEFLQGQVSCDIREVKANKIQQGALCNLKGRVLALFAVIDWQGLQLVLPKDLLAATQFSLSKPAMLSRVKLEPSFYSIFGFYLTNPKDIVPANTALPSFDLGFNSGEGWGCYRLNPQLYVILINKEQPICLTQPFIRNQQLRGSLAWHQLQLRHKKIEIYPETRGLFLPHRMDLHLSGHLSFNKGCYKGQEIVARTHYRAKLKHRLALFSIETTEQPRAGKKLFSESGTEMGELIDYCPLANNQYLIAVSILHDHPQEAVIESHTHSIILQPW